MSHKVKGPTSTSKGQHQASGIKRPFCAPPANLHGKQYSSHHSPGPCFQRFPFFCAFQTTKIMINCSPPPQTFSASQTFPWMPKRGLGKKTFTAPGEILEGQTARKSWAIHGTHHSGVFHPTWVCYFCGQASVRLPLPPASLVQTHVQ